MIDNSNLFEKHILSGKQTTTTNWGRIFKGEHIDNIFSVTTKTLIQKYGLEESTHSIAIAQMNPYAVHRPYIRFVDEQPTACRIYKILSGSMEFVKDGHLVTLTSEDDEVVVHNGDLFSFKASNEGCVFQIHDFPAFEVGFDENNPRFH